MPDTLSVQDEKKLPRRMSVPEMSRIGCRRITERSCGKAGDTASLMAATRSPQVFPVTVGASQFIGTSRFWSTLYRLVMP